MSIGLMQIVDCHHCIIHCSLNCASNELRYEPLQVLCEVWLCADHASQCLPCVVCCDSLPVALKAEL